MKRIRTSVGLFLLTLATVVSVTGCFGGRSNQQPNTNNQQTSQPQTTTTQESTTVQESNGGVIDGLMNDVNRGVEDITGETRSSTNGSSANRVNDSTVAADESR